jgi:hypothetical protein
MKMKVRLRAIVSASLFGFFFVARVSAQDLQTNVTYVCNGQRVVIDSCNIRDTSDSSKCMVGHPDTVLPNGLMKYTTETRGDLKKLLPTCKQPSADEVKRAQAFNKRIQDQQDAARKKAEQSSIAPYPATQGGGAVETPRDPETRAMYRCVAAGRLPAVCMGNGLMGSLMGNVNGILSSMVPGAVGKEVTGPQMAGVFLGNGQWRLEFSEASVGLSCADMRTDSHAYTIAIVNNRAVITISSTPKDIVLLLNGDTLTGAGSVVVDGVVSGGVHDGIDYSGRPATVYLYQRVTRTCPRPVLSSKGAGPGVVGAEKNVLLSMFNDGDTGPPTPAGLRMNGSYASPTGFSVGFYPESAIIGCGPDAARAYPYDAVANGAQAYVKINAPDHPITMSMKPDGSLDPGSGPYQVHGRTITGEDAKNDFTFAPLEVTCNLGPLKPGPIPSSFTPAMASAAPPSAAPAGPSGSTMAGSSGNAVLSIAPTFPAQAGGTNAFAGHTFVLLRDSLETTLSKGGFQVPQGASAYKTMITACANRQPTCQTAISALNANTAAGVRLGPEGKATFPSVAPGSYYLMGSASPGGHSFVWDLRVDLRSGANTVSLAETNGAPLN